MKSPIINSEKALRKVAVTTLRKMGYTVLIVGGGLVACKRCGARVQTGNGSSPGVPDLFVTHPGWGEYTWLAIELKFGDGELRDAQQALVAEGFVRVCKSVEAVLEEVKNYEQRWVKYAEFAGF